ncbi:MAG: hypothetical protein D9V44_09430 [Actinobacteria bacterium]|nr:MAG: hypothetical protein D9V44_09430 [Actinomycetota bacterium]
MDVMRGISGKVLALLDRREKEVHIRPEHASNGAFKRLHEVGHHIIPCQSDLAYADDYFTLSPETSALFELQANHVAAELLFQGTLLQEQAASRRLRAKSVLELSATFGATIHSTFRRLVETNAKPVAGVVLNRQPSCIAPLSFERREAFSSVLWRSRYHDPHNWPQWFDSGPFEAVVPHVAAVSTLLESGSYKDPIRTRIPWPDLNGEIRAMRIEVFTNTYHIFVLFAPSRAVLLSAH